MDATEWALAIVLWNAQVLCLGFTPTEGRTGAMSAVVAEAADTGT